LTILVIRTEKTVFKKPRYGIGSESDCLFEQLDRILNQKVSKTIIFQ